MKLVSMDYESQLHEQITKEVEEAHWKLFNLNSSDQSALATYRRQIINEVRRVTEPIIARVVTRDELIISANPERLQKGLSGGKMIYEKLLGEINAQIKELELAIKGNIEVGTGYTNSFVEEQRRDLSAWKTLRAAVELHGPKGTWGDTYVNGDPVTPYCDQCEDRDFYPCPTIQMIIRLLS